jgi:hypothetical protein
LPLRGYFRALCAAVGMGLVVYVLDQVLAWLKMPAEATLLDDVLLGLLVGILVLSQEIMHQRELRRQRQQLAIVGEMNHHVRNALQTIVYLSSELRDQNAIEQMMTATRRIEWALREVLPGTSLDDDDPPGSRPPSRPDAKAQSNSESK